MVCHRRDTMNDLDLYDPEPSLPRCTYHQPCGEIACRECYEDDDRMAWAREVVRRTRTEFMNNNEKETK